MATLYVLGHLSHFEGAIRLCLRTLRLCLRPFEEFLRTLGLSVGPFEGGLWLFLRTLWLTLKPFDEVLRQCFRSFEGLCGYVLGYLVNLFY